MSAAYHLPVLVDEVCEALAPARAGTVVDCTLGGGGHSEAILERVGAARVIGLDRDPALRVRELLGLSHDLASRVEERTSGNPMFAVHLVGDWVSRGLLTVEKGALSLPADEEVELPDDLHALWSRRVERLTEGSAAPRLSLELAAVLGPELPIAGWRAASASLGVPLEEDFLAKVLRSHLVTASPDGRELRFAHEMIRESLLRNAREGGRLPALHSAAADALEPLVIAGNDALAEPLARHLMDARRFDDALAVSTAPDGVAGGVWTPAPSLLARRVPNTAMKKQSTSFSSTSGRSVSILPLPAAIAVAFAMGSDVP